MITHERSTSGDDEYDQPTSDNDDVPEPFPGPPPPPGKPAECASQPSEPRSVKLEGEKKSVASFDDACTNGDADTSGAPRRDESARERSRKLPNASERIRKRLERRGEENLHKQAPEGPDEPGGETAAPGEHQDHQGSPEDDRKRRDDATNVSCRDTDREAIEWSRTGRDPSRAVGGVESMQTTSKTMASVAIATGATATAIRTRQVEI